MIFKRDNLVLGIILGFLAPLLGLVLLKYYKFQMFSWKEVMQFLYVQPGHAMLTSGLSVSLLINALLFTIYVNTRRDLTAKGIFFATLFYGLLILGIKFFS